MIGTVPRAIEASPPSLMYALTLIRLDTVLALTYDARMSSLKQVGWSRMDMLIADMGEGGVLDMLCGRVSNGEAPHEVAQSMGMPWHVFRRWMEADPKRMDEMALAKRCYAEKLAWDSISEVVSADIETVPLAKLRSDKYEKMAGKMDRGTWGDKVDGNGGGGGITVVINGFGTEPPCIVPALECDVVEVLDAGN